MVGLLRHSQGKPGANGVGLTCRHGAPARLYLRKGLSRIRRAALPKGVVRAAAECTAGRAESHRRARAGRPLRAASPRRSRWSAEGLDRLGGRFLGGRELEIQGRGWGVCVGCGALDLPDPGGAACGRVRRVRGEGAEVWVHRGDRIHLALRRAYEASAGYVQAPPLWWANWIRGIGAVHGGRRQASRAWSRGSAGPSASAGRSLGSCGSFVEAGAAEPEGTCATGSGVAVGERTGSCCSARPSGAVPSALLSLRRRQEIKVASEY
jgi:hypothetical protein